MKMRNSVKIAVMAVLLAVICVPAHAAGNSTGYAWSENTGWSNFNAPGGGVTVYADHLEGYAWNGNIGWIRLGAFTAGTAHTYANTSAGDYGVNNNGTGTLSGYGWSENVGWIRFNPPGGGVTVDGSGNFSGYAWNGNIGWIHFAGTASDSSAYKVVTTWISGVTTYLLTVNTDVAGTGSGTVGGGGNYASGVTVTPVATPTGGSTVVWTPSSCAAGFAMPANAYTCTAKFSAAVAPPITASVVLNSLGSITGSTVVAYGTATGTGIGERGFYWWIPPTTATHFGGSESGLIPEGYGAGSFSLKLTDLRLGHTYHVKAYVKVGGQIITSDEQLFTTVTTGKMAPTVLTDTANYTVSGNSITVSGEITDVGSTPVNVYGFIFAPHSAPFTGDDMLKTGDRAYAMWDKTPLYQGMKFTGTVKNIPPGKWYLRAYAHNTNQDSSADQPESLGYGEDISFTIPCTPETCIPGDVNGDGKVSLDDAMLVLRILAGLPVGNVNLNADVNGDGKIGLEELGFILQKVAELRPS